MTKLRFAANYRKVSIIFIRYLEMILFNDNMGGGNLVRGNVLWASNQETNDHGPLSSWSRMPYLNVEGAAAGEKASVRPAWNHLSHNLVVASWRGQAGFSGTPFNFDDGTDFMNVSENVLIYGCFLGGWHSRQAFSYARILTRVPKQSS